MKKRKVKYTKKMHAHRLSLMLLRKDPCSKCPRNIDFSVYKRANWVSPEYESCRICRVFVGIGSPVGCPCNSLGSKEAIRRSVKALKDYYAS